MREKTKKATFSLHTSVLAALDEAASKGLVSSKNALVEQALLREFRELKKKERKALIEEAMRDPLFVKDIKEVEADFQQADAETAERLD